MKKPPAMPQMASFEELGIMSMMPGIQYAIEHLENMLDEMRAKLDAVRKGLPSPAVATDKQDQPVVRETTVTPVPVKKKKKKKQPADDVPMEVGGLMTRYGLAKELDVTPSNVWFKLDRAGIKGKKIKHPTKRGSRLTVYSPTEAQKARKLFGKKQPKNRGGALSSKHPSNPNHPGHEAWKQKMAEVNRKNHEIRRQQKADEVKAA